MMRLALAPAAACVVLVATIAGALHVATAVPMGQLAERPIAGVVAHPAIGYYTQPTEDAVAEVNRRIGDGSAHIGFDEESGYLRPVLAALHLSATSQMLVMSKTGIQGLHTGPENPRALYFNDTVTLGYTRGAQRLHRPGRSAALAVRQLRSRRSHAVPAALGRLVRHRHARIHAPHGE